MNDFFDILETRAPVEREAAQRVALLRQLAHAQAHAPAFSASLAGVDTNAITS